MLKYVVCLLLTCLVTRQAVMQTIVDQENPDSNSESCMTISGDKPNLPCVFPFSAGGGLQTFHACFWKDDLQDFVCSTKTDSAGNHITGNLGICGESCPKQCNKYSSWPCNGKCIPLGNLIFLLLKKIVIFFYQELLVGMIVRQLNTLGSLAITYTVMAPVAGPRMMTWVFTLNQMVE